LTHKIRSLAEHLSANPKDNSNKRSLRSLVHKRQQILKYFARKEPLQYEPLLADLGLERKAVEGEIAM
jgi:small subunit ribosomal protein S15